MSSEWLEPPDNQHLIEYHGAPKDQDAPGEESKWKRFLKWACPWLREKANLGEDFLAAKVAREQAEALVKLAEASERMANARKTYAEAATIASKLDAAKVETIKQVLKEQPIDVTIQKCQEELEDKIAQARLLYGTRIHQIGEAVPTSPETSDKKKEDPKA